MIWIFSGTSGRIVPNRTLSILVTGGNFSVLSIVVVELLELLEFTKFIRLLEFEYFLKELSTISTSLDKLFETRDRKIQ